MPLTDKATDVARETAMDPRRSSRTARRFLPVLLLAGLLGATLLAGCTFFKFKPLTVDDVDEDSPQSPAAITLSDPQIYSRETLVNDRRREADYLKDLIEGSKDAVFEPQIRRDLRLLTSTVVALRAAYDPLAGRQAGRKDELAELQQKTEVAQQLKALAEARVALEEAQKRLDEIDAKASAVMAEGTSSGDTPSPDTPDGNAEQPADDGSGDGNGDDTPDGAQESKTKGIFSDLAMLKTDVDQLEKIIAALPEPAEVRQASVKATPQEIFHDRQAYRAELRGALAEVELDDAHDLGQNSLYRLQFRATVLPGAHQRQMGVARLTLEPPELDQDDVLELYKTWLGHVTYRLNQPAAGGLQHDRSYLLMGMGLERSLFHSTNLKLRTEDTDLFVALPPGIYAKWKKVTQKTCPGSGPKADPEASEACPCVTSDLADSCPDLAVIRDKVDRALSFVHRIEEHCRTLPSLGARCEPPRDEEAHDHWELLQDLAAIEPFMSASLRGLGDVGSIDSKTERHVTGLIEKIIDGADTLDRLRYLFLAKCRHCPDGLGRGASIASQAGAVPQAFVDAVVRPFSDPKAICRPRSTGGNHCRLGVAHGGADVYATAPVELAQRISTTSSAVRSFESAVALAAALPTHGLEAGASLRRLRATQSDIEAIESLPLVVGFAERRTRPPSPGPDWSRKAKTCTSEDRCEKDDQATDTTLEFTPQRWPIAEDPQFGWVFGPQATIDAKERQLRLRRPVVNYPVTVDLSIPGWWPRVRLVLETAWVKSWHGGQVIDPLGDKMSEPKVTRFPLYLPLNRADLDGLTEYLAQKTVGGALPYTAIAAVSPAKITTCRDDVTFLVYGANVWRSSVGYLNGLEADSIRVLPDMAGVAVTFSSLKEGLPQIPGSGGKARLTLWTRNGASSRDVTVIDPKAAGLTCGKPEKPGLAFAVAKHALVPEAKDEGQEKDKTSKTWKATVKIVTGALPPGYNHLGIFVRPTKPLTEGAMHTWSPKVDKTATRDDEKAGNKTVQMVKGPLDLSTLDLKTGDTLEASLVVTPAPNAEGKRYAVDGELVYYAKAKEAQIRVQTEKLETLGTIDLLLPYRYDIAYPDLRGGKVTFGLEADALGEYTLSFREPKPSSLPKGDEKDDAKRVLHLQLVLLGKDGSPVKDQAKIDSFLSASRTLSVTIGGGDELPETTGSVNLEK